MRHGKLFALSVAIALGWTHPAPAKGASIELTGTGPAALSFTLIDNRIFVPAVVNGGGPYQFVFDTGGANILDAAVAQELNLDLEDDGAATGAGAATQQAWRTRVESARIGDIAIRGHAFRVISLDAIRRAIGLRRLDGIVGRELFERFVVDIDYAKGTLTLSEPKSWRAPRELGRALTLGFYYNIPSLPASVDGLSGTFIIDTGDRSSLTLFGPFVDRNRLRAKYARSVRTITGWGIGGPIPADVTRGGRFEFGGHTVSGVVTRMPLLQTGGFASSGAAGSIGTGVLKRFRAVFDYSRKRMFLAPNAAFAAPDPADRSGLWLSQDEGGLKVMSVVPGSPADQSGVKVDDIVTAVDGVAAARLFLVDLRQRLKTDGPGSVVRLTLKTAAGARDVELVLRDLI